MTGIDTDPDSIALARRQDLAGRIDYHLGDFLIPPVPSRVLRRHHLRGRAAPPTLCLAGDISLPTG